MDRLKIPISPMHCCRLFLFQPFVPKHLLTLCLYGCLLLFHLHAQGYEVVQVDVNVAFSHP